VDSINQRLDLVLPEAVKPSDPGGSWSLRSYERDCWAWHDHVFTPLELDAINNIFDDITLISGRAGDSAKQTARDSDVAFIYPNPVTQWIFERLTAIVNDLNDKYFCFDLEGFTQGLQLTSYQPGQHYRWHTDHGPRHYNRKLSLTLQLSEPTDYEGGELQLRDSDKPMVMDKQRGLLVAFPAYLMHRVTPVTSGRRRSLVAWVTGEPFK